MPPRRGRRGVGPLGVVAVGATGAYVGSRMAKSSQARQDQGSTSSGGAHVQSSGAKKLRLTCPDGCQQGSILKIQYDSVQYEITVPPGVVAGQAFDVIINPPPPAIARAAPPTPTVTASAVKAEPAATTPEPVQATAVPVESSTPAAAAAVASEPPSVSFSKWNPFAHKSSEEKAVWPVESIKSETDKTFEGLSPTAQAAGAPLSLSPDQVRSALLPLGLSEDSLSTVWEQSDIDQDGRLDQDEWAVAQWLCRRCLSGVPIAASLDPALIPPSKRKTI
eukprot:CAMPEP_0171939872 /NCGR_PEP_ID=MMETSP0993-20121228/36653_1 /TAXON_ID=483369 /ORGANISM="non described non described, Strain CCMP2098" /LENGTH=277 /DNA_ID=CAMNT_0012581795 /DNA_START=124 /DNA_END=957 /DNA_ORIENTATION=-